MIVTRFLNFIVGNNQFQSIFASIDHSSMIVTKYDDQNFQLNYNFGVDLSAKLTTVSNSVMTWSQMAMHNGLL